MSDYVKRDLWQSLPDDLPYKASVKRVLMQAPAEDVRPVVRSSWEFLRNGDGICLRCGSLQKHIWDVAGWQNFCGHCGADMR